MLHANFFPIKKYLPCFSHTMKTGQTSSVALAALPAFVAGMEVWELDVRLRSGGEGKTIASVNHRITSLAEDVNREVQAFADGFDGYIERWRNSINSKLREQ